jgi:acetoin utilization protein AcuB
MLVEKYIDHSIPVLNISDTVKTAVKKFEESNLNQLPVKDKDTFLGLLQRSVAEGIPDTKLKLEGIKLEGQTLGIAPEMHILEAIKIASEADLQVLGVTETGSDHYLGAVTRSGLEDYLAMVHGVRANGSILVLSMNERDYSLHELSRIIESNGAKILAMFSDVKEDDPYTILITLKLNLIDLSRVIAALQRYDYTIVFTFHKEEFESREKERLEHLLRFLEI